MAMGKELVRQNEYLKLLRSMHETSELHWEFISASTVDFLFTHHNIVQSKYNRDIIETGIRFVVDTRRSGPAGHTKLRMEIPGNTREFLYMNLSDKGALLVSQDFFDKPDQNWLRKYSVGRGAFTFVFGDNPMKTGGGDRFYINYSMKMEKRVDRIPS